MPIKHVFLNENIQVITKINRLEVIELVNNASKFRKDRR